MIYSLPSQKNNTGKGAYVLKVQKKDEIRIDPTKEALEKFQQGTA